MRKTETILELERLVSRPDLVISKPNTSAGQDRAWYRRKRVNQLSLKGYTISKIAKEVKRSESTIEKDLRAIRELSRQWYEEEAITDYCQSINDGIILYDNAIEALRILYSEEIQTDKKLQIISAILEYSTKKTRLCEQTESVQRYLRRA